MTKIILKIKRDKGFVILFAITLASIILSITLGVANVTYKELKFSTSTKYTDEAFFAADTAVECALYYDRGDQNKFPMSGPATAFNCAGASITPILSGAAPSVLYGFTVVGLGSGGLNCAKVTVAKNGVAPSIATVVVSKGYNLGGDGSCASTSLNLIEREIRISY